MIRYGLKGDCILEITIIMIVIIRTIVTIVIIILIITDIIITIIITINNIFGVLPMTHIFRPTIEQWSNKSDANSSGIAQTGVTELRRLPHLCYTDHLGR